MKRMIMFMVLFSSMIFGKFEILGMSFGMTEAQITNVLKIIKPQSTTFFRGKTYPLKCKIYPLLKEKLPMRLKKYKGKYVRVYYNDKRQAVAIEIIYKYFPIKEIMRIKESFRKYSREYTLEKEPNERIFFISKNIFLKSKIININRPKGYATMINVYYHELAIEKYAQLTNGRKKSKI